MNYDNILSSSSYQRTQIIADHCNTFHNSLCEISVETYPYAYLLLNKDPESKEAIDKAIHHLAWAAHWLQTLKK